MGMREEVISILEDSIDMYKLKEVASIKFSPKEKVTYVDLISEKTIDEFIVKNLRAKINLATKVLGEDLKKWLI